MLAAGAAFPNNHVPVLVVQNAVKFFFFSHMLLSWLVLILISHLSWCVMPHAVVWELFSSRKDALLGFTLER